MSNRWHFEEFPETDFQVSAFRMCFFKKNAGLSHQELVSSGRTLNL
jgi:hypothetical protein